MQSEASSVQQLDMFAGASQEERLCLDCDVDISHRRRDAQRCEPCSTIRNRQRARNHYRENRTEKLLYEKSRQQTPEYRRSRQEWKERNPETFLVYRQRKKQSHREKTGYNPEGRTCENCLADISRRGHRAKRCERCSSPPVRTCIVCRGDIRKRGPSKYCSEQCKQQDRQSKELEGYTKTCTTCNETKAHTEFGWHKNRRRPTCKSCEVKSQSERYHNFTPEQRARRNRLRRKRAQITRASLTPAERTMQKTKAREALMRKRFGDFDEYAEYMKQDGKCAICGRAKPFKKDATANDCLELDHDHDTGRPRGFLCKNCNLKLLSRYEKRFPPQHQDSPYLNAYLSKGKS